MYQEKRPTCVTVIGWVWIVFGALMAFAAVMALAGSLLMRGMLQGEPHIPSFLKFYPYLAGLQLLLAALGLIAAVNFLKLRAWSRAVLEGLTWLVLAFVIIFMIFFFAEVRALSAGPSGFGAMVAIMSVAISIFYGVPLAIMLMYLRGARVRTAMTRRPESDHGPV